MREKIFQTVVESLREMNYRVAGVAEDTLLGPAGINLESLALAELAVRMEDAYGVAFDENDLEKVAAMTIGEVCGYVADALAAGDDRQGVTATAAAE